MVQLTSVFKSFVLTVLLWAAIALLIVHPATGNLLLAETGSSPQKPDSVETQKSPPVEEKTDSEQPAEKSERSTVRSAEANLSSRSQGKPVSPYDMQEIERFDDDLYGT